MSALPLSLSLPALSTLGVSPSSGAASAMGASFMGPSSGDWNVNLGGSGVAFQAGTGSVLLLAGVLLVAIWLLKN